MRSVWKFSVPENDIFTRWMPRGAIILSIAEQHGDACMWAEVDPKAPEETRSFRLAGTGHPMPSNEKRRFIGTVPLHGGSLVFHLFEIEEVE